MIPSMLFHVTLREYKNGDDLFRVLLRRMKTSLDAMCHTLLKRTLILLLILLSSSCASLSFSLSFFVSLSSLTFRRLTFFFSFSLPLFTRKNRMTKCSVYFLLVSSFRCSFLAPCLLALSLSLSLSLYVCATQVFFFTRKVPFSLETRALHSVGPLILIKEQQKALVAVASISWCIHSSL